MYKNKSFVEDKKDKFTKKNQETLYFEHRNRKTDTGVPKKTYDALFFKVGAQNAANSFNFQT